MTATFTHYRNWVIDLFKAYTQKKTDILGIVPDASHIG